MKDHVKEVEEAIKDHESRKGRRIIRGGGRNVESSWKERNKKVDRAMQPGGKGQFQENGDSAPLYLFLKVKVIQWSMVHTEQ